jgi:hypothetical protein
MKYFVIPFVLLLFISSCKKDKPVVDDSSESQNDVSTQLYGEYHWRFSRISGTNFIDNTEDTSSYMISINEDGLFYLKDGDVFKHYDNAVHVDNFATGERYIALTNNSDNEYERIDYGLDRPGQEFHVLDTKNFPYECNQAYYLPTGNYFVRAGENVDIESECFDYRDSIAGNYTGDFIEIQFSGMNGTNPQFDTIQNYSTTVTLDRVVFNNIADSATCIYTSSNYFSDTLFVRGFIKDPIFSDYNWTADFYQNNLRDYWGQGVTDYGNGDGPVFQFWTRDVYQAQNGQTGAYRPVQFIGYK